MDSMEIKDALIQAVKELLEVSHIQKGEIFVVGCSTSEILGKQIGKATSKETAVTVYNTISSILKEKGIYLAVQGCEHINRSLVVDRECAQKLGLSMVNVVPQLNAGGGLAVAAYEGLQDPVMVEEVCAAAGMDIGDTLIGMHIKKVAIPVRSSVKKIGEAHLTMARSRLKLIGGDRAVHFKE
ncbi:TIGR01440 family protein [Vagococcus elongatus]|uniref:UPF0340 protein CBF29_00070 n=1 Tax=Vagococcus elongatus TaxID=180344 RepID=A0A430B579_9ENTE|nr:TIGR01440 family protein [Vagococcus elongatus]RSU15510.1 TIGR01440 family protein [Vagococcus elongatus]